MNHDWRIVEKRNHLHLHSLFTSKESAERFLRETIPVYVERGYYMDKTLTANDFEVLPPKTHEVVTDESGS
jgi:hypothetical protein